MHKFLVFGTFLYAPIGTPPVAFAVVNVTCTGTASTNGTPSTDTLALQNALTTAGTTGDTVLVAPGVCNINSTLTIGSGSATVVSPLTGAILAGSGQPGRGGVNYPSHGTTLEFYGSGYAISILGPLQGWGLQNFQLLCESPTAQSGGVSVTSAQYGTNHDLSIINCAIGIISSTVSAKPPGIQNVDSLHNSWHNLFIEIPNNTTVEQGINFQPQQGGDTDYNDFDNVVIDFGTPNTTQEYGIYDAGGDTNYFRNIHFVWQGGGACATCNSIVFDYTSNTGRPDDETFVHVDWGSVVNPKNVGSLAKYVAPNVFMDVVTNNKGAFPTGLANAQRITSY
jgi:hypothetical protein